MSCLTVFTVNAQTCPPNIDFEEGSFAGWTCYTGNVAAVGGSNVISLTPSGGPISGRHTMYSAYNGGGLDPYGNFPVNCPNGSGFSIRLGNNQGGGEAEGISYEFTIPANQNYYSLIYHYAVVFQDPNHLINEQPRMEIEIVNLTDNVTISCSSFTFIPFGSVLPGFQLSDNPGSTTPVWYKDWSAVSINLDNLAGKTIRLFFKTADCTFRRHFGYAYIDVNSECSSTFVGAAYCHQDTSVQVVAPYGYQSYQWYDISFTQLLGTQQILRLAPPPPNGTTLAVILKPYTGYGCLDTLYAQLYDTLKIKANAGRDTVACNHNPVPIGSIAIPGLVYNWSPVTGLSDATLANPLANPDVTTTYVLTVNTSGGGCLERDTVTVKADVLDNSIELLGTAAYCIGSGDSAVLQVHPADSIQWVKDNIPIPGAHQTTYRVTQSGSYYAILFSFKGCILATVPQVISIASIPVARFTLTKDTQCLMGNKFVFSNTSSNTVGEMQYHWFLGDGTEAATRDITHIYKKAGKYQVRLLVNSSAICADSSVHTVVVLQNAIADFSFKPICINLPLQLINNSIDTMNTPINYLWNLGNGQTSVLRTPPVLIYPTAGAYPITLTVSTTECPSPVNTIKHFISVDMPKTAIRYPLKYAVENWPLSLSARLFGESVLWTPANSLDVNTSYTPVFTGVTDQLYTIEIKTRSGCVTVDTQLIKTVKHVEVFVPNAFTPNNDGINDLLHPLSFGIKKLEYFKIYNRWGQLVFEMDAEQPGWDGTFKGAQLEMQTIVWIFKGIGVDGNVYSKKGTSMLLR